MITSINRVTAMNSRTPEDISLEVEYLSSTLSILRDSEEITNDEFLEAGTIQGGLSLLAAMISNGAEGTEVELQISSLVKRAASICDRYPGIDGKLESMM